MTDLQVVYKVQQHSMAASAQLQGRRSGGVHQQRWAQHFLCTAHSVERSAAKPGELSFYAGVLVSCVIIA